MRIVTIATTLSLAALHGGCGSTATVTDCSPAPVAVAIVAPAYDPEPADASVSAYAVLSFVIDKNGQVGGVEVIESGATPANDRVAKDFAKAARQSTALWRFNRRGTPCRSQHRLEYPG